MPKYIPSWEEIESSEDYTSLDTERQSNVRSVHFDDIATRDHSDVAPDKIAQAKQSWMDDFKPSGSVVYPDKQEQIDPLGRERGIGGDILHAIAKGAPKSLEMLGKGVSVLDLDSQSDGGVADEVGAWLEGLGKKLEKSDIMRPDISEVAGKEGYVKRKTMEGLSALVPSATPIALGLGAAGAAAVGAAAVGVSAPVAVIGAAVGTGAMAIQFGLGTFKEKMDELAEKRPDLPIAERRKVAAGHGAIEFGGELVSDVLAAFTGGAIGKVATQQAVKGGIKSLVTMSAKGFAKRYGITLLPEWATETGQMYAQSRLDEGVGIGDAVSLFEAAKETAIPTLVMHSVFSGGAYVGNEALQRKTISDLNSEDPEIRTKAYENVLGSFEEEDADLAEAWQNYAGKAIQEEKPIAVDYDFSQERAEPAGEEIDIKQAEDFVAGMMDMETHSEVPATIEQAISVATPEARKMIIESGVYEQHGLPRPITAADEANTAMDEAIPDVVQPEPVAMSTVFDFLPPEVQTQRQDTFHQEVVAKFKAGEALTEVEQAHIQEYSEHLKVAKEKFAQQEAARATIMELEGEEDIQQMEPVDVGAGVQVEALSEETGIPAAQWEPGVPISDVTPEQAETDFSENVTKALGKGQQADAIISLISARAKTLGLATGEYIRQRGLSVVADAEGRFDAALIQDAKGGVDLMTEGKAVISAFKKADVSTFVHEIGHVFRKELTREELSVADKWAGVKIGEVWGRSNEEKFSRAWENYIATGKAPNAELKSLFDKFTVWMKSIYAGIKGTEIDVNVSPEMRKLFDGLITREEVVPAEFKKDVKAVEEIAKEDPHRQAMVEAVSMGGISIKSAKQMLSVDTYNELRKPGLFTKDGQDIDDIATQLGYESANDLVDSWTKTPLKKEAIAKELQEQQNEFDRAESARQDVEGVLDEEGVLRDAGGEVLFQEDQKPVDTTSPNFKRWFKDSKVVDEAGEPLVVYHGTGAEVTDNFAFDYDRIGEQGRGEGAGFYFTSNKRVAEGYGKDGSVINAYMSIQKPLSYDSPPFDINTVEKIVKRLAEIESKDYEMDIEDGFLSNYGDARYEGLDSVVSSAAELIAEDNTALDQLGGFVGSGVEPKHVNEAVRDITGYDGVIAGGFGGVGDETPIYVAFFPQQIKSATSNTGEFSLTEPSILKQMAPVAVKPVKPLTARDLTAKKRELREVGFYSKYEEDTEGSERGKRVVLASEVPGGQKRLPENIARKNFKLWFDGSLAVDKDGKPQTWFHGSPTFGRADAPDSWAFDQSRKGENVKHPFTGLGMTFTPHYEMAKTSARGGQVTGFNLQLRNPYVLTKDDIKNLSTYSKEEGHTAKSQAFLNRKMGLGDFDSVYDPNTGFMYVPNSVQSKELRNIGTYSETAENVLFQKDQEPAPTWYSPTARTVANLKQQKGSGKQILAMIRKTPGVKPEELDWIGLPEWLNEKKSITREEIAEFVDAGGVQVEEVVKGGGAEITSDETLELGELVRKYDDFGFDSTGLALRAVRENEDWVDRWDIDDKRLIELGDKYRNEQTTTRHSQYQVPGGKNYKEILLTLPVKRLSDSEARKVLGVPQAVTEKLSDADITYASNKKANLYKSPEAHWSEANVLAFVRFNERTDKDDKRVLFLEEVQSDWHQEGRRMGYDEGMIDKARSDQEIYSKTLYDKYGLKSKPARGDEYRTFKQGLTPDERSEVNRHVGIVDDAINAGRGVPDAPFKKTPAWSGLAMKRMIRYASENGFDSIAWTSGEQQAERYDLSKQVDGIGWEKETDGTITIKWQPKGWEEYLESPDWISTTPAKLSDVVGKELADRINKDSSLEGHYEGLDLKVGGEGMKSFYDKMLPNTVNKLIKKSGSKVQVITVGDNQQLGFQITEKMRESAIGEGMPLFQTEKRTNTVKVNNPESNGSPAKGRVMIEKIMRDLRLTSTTKAEQVKYTPAKERKHVEAFLALKNLAVDPHASVASKQKMLASFVGVLPPKVAKKMATKLAFISRYKGTPVHQKRLDEALTSAEKFLNQHLRRTIAQDIKKGLKSTKLAKNRIKKSMVGHEAARDLEYIRLAVDDKDAGLRAHALTEKIVEAESKLEEIDTEVKRAIQEDLIADLRAKQGAYETFGDLRSQNLDDLVAAKEDLKSLIADGRSTWRATQDYWKDTFAQNNAILHRDIAGVDDPTVETVSAALKRKAAIKTLPGQVKKFGNWVDNSILSWEFVVDKVSGKSGKGTLKSNSVELFGSQSADGSRKENAYNLESKEQIHDKALEIMGVKDAKQLNKKWGNLSKKQDNKVHIYPNGNKTPILVSPLEMAYWYAIRKNADSIPTWNEHGVTEQTFQEIESYMGKDLIAWTDYVVDEFLQDFHYPINEVYRAINGVNLTKTPGYITWNREVTGKEQDAGFASKAETGVGGMGKSAHKQRVANTKMFQVSDLNSVLMNHVYDMNNYRAWAIPSKIINGSFNNGITQKLIVQHTSMDTLNAVKSFQSDFAKSPHELRGELPWLDKMRGNITTAMVGMNPTIFLKQQTSIPAMMESIPTASWLKYSGHFWANPRKAMRTLLSSTEFKARRDTGMERDIRTAQTLSGSEAIAGTATGIRKAAKMSMFMVKAGDSLAVMIGGYPVYLHHYNKNKPKLGHAKAHDIAIRKFEMAMDRTQQASGIKDQGRVQRGGSYAKLFTMFMTTPAAYTRNITAAIRNFSSDPRDSSKRLFVFGVMMPALFSATASGFLGLIGGDEEDKEEFWGEMAGAIGMSLGNGIPIIRDLQTGVWNAAMGTWYGSDLTLSPAFESGQSLIDIVQNGARYFNEDRTLSEKDDDLVKTINSVADFIGFSTGIPVQPMRRWLWQSLLQDIPKGETEAPFRRALGYSRSAMGESRGLYSKYTRSVNEVEKAIRKGTPEEREKAQSSDLLAIRGYTKGVKKRISNLSSRAKKADERDDIERVKELESQIDDIKSEYVDRYRDMFVTNV